MKKIMNITTSVHDLPRYGSNSDLKAFYRDLGLDGLEVMQAGEDKEGIILPEDTIGIHMKYFVAWMDLWLGNEKRLLKEFDDWETAEGLFGGRDGTALVETFRKNLAFAATLEPEYLVFHVSECHIAESMLRKYHYTDEEVIDAAIDLVHSFTGAIEGTPLLLFENLWYSGLTMLRPEITQRLLDGVRYPHKGIMLDVGHLLHTTMSLRTPEEALAHLYSVADLYGDCDIIKGLHLHQTLSGALAGELTRTWQRSDKTYRERYWDVLPYIYQIDSHQPFAHEGVKALVERFAPEYLVLEQISADREVHRDGLARQLAVL